MKKFLAKGLGLFAAFAMTIGIANATIYAAVTEVQVIQVMAKGFNPNDGTFYDMTKYVAGKSTLIRAVFDEETEVVQDGSMVVTVTKGGERVAELIPINSGVASEALFAPKNLADVSNWDAGDYNFSFSGNGTTEKAVTFSTSKTIKVLSVPIKANYGGTVVSCEGEWKTAIQFTKDTYPLANNGIENVLGNELDLSGPEYDLMTDDGQYKVWEALKNLQTPNNDYELILGYVRNRQGADASTQGYTYGKPANIITESDGDMQPTVAHEIAHCYSLGDEYPGGSINNPLNPAPFDMQGHDYADREKQVKSIKEAVVGAPNSSGSLIHNEQAAYNTMTLTPVLDAGSFMGSNGDKIEYYWISSDVWNHLFNVFVNGNAEERPYEQGTFVSGGETAAAENIDIPMAAKLSKTASTTAVAEPEQPAEVNAIDISGTIYVDGKFTVKPWYTYTTETSQLTGKTSGEYSVVMKDANGKTLSTKFFDISFMTFSNPPKKTEFMPVDLTVEYVTGTASIQIMKGTTELFKLDVPKNKPVIEFAEGAESYSGKAQITWTASHEDEKNMWYELWYCPNEYDFINIAADITTTSYTVDFDTLPGTDEGYFYLYATDGVNTSEVASEFFTVDYKAPEILTAQAEATYKITDEIKLQSDIYDKQEGWLYDDASVTWTLKGREFITGDLLWIYPYELSPGTHVFTLSAKNSKGIEVKKDFSITISNDESALPNDWSRADIKSALSNGFVAPLSNVNSAITRGQYAKLMANLYWNVWEEGSPEPEYEEGIVTDCGQDDYDQFLMVSLGIMTADKGKFNPNGNVTQEEATEIMYKTCALADPSYLSPDIAKKEMIDTLFVFHVMGKNGDNIYAPSEKITGRLALVRCNRLYTAIFGEEESSSDGEGNSPFSDVNQSAWYAPYVSKALENGILKTTSGLFEPDKAISMYDFLEMTASTLKMPEAEKAEFLAAFSAADVSLTRVEAARILSGVLSQKGIAVTPVDITKIFTDCSDSKFTAEIGAVYSAKIMVGVSANLFSPQGNLSRAQAVAIQANLQNALGN